MYVKIGEDLYITFDPLIESHPNHNSFVLFHILFYLMFSVSELSASLTHQTTPKKWENLANSKAELRDVFL